MTSDQNLTTNELAVLESLHGAEEAISQRELARRTGLSVGLINAVLKKLVHTGYVKTSRLNRRSIEYLLTPDGFAQTALKSYRYVLRTVREYRSIQMRLHEVLLQLRADGVRDFHLHGDCELAELVAALFEEEDAFGTLQRVLPIQGATGAVILNAMPTALADAPCRVVNLVQELGSTKISC